MKISLGRKLAILFAIAFLVPFWWNQSVAVASAASPTFTKSKVEIIGGNETYQLEIQNKVSKSTYKWATSNAKVAKVSSKGLVTSVGKGSTTIKCKVTYPSGKSTTLSCKVTVSIPATDIVINNANEVNGAHVLLIGETFDFNRTLTPKNSSDKTYWTIDGADKGCITVDKNGKVTAIKAGKVILTATAAKSSDPKILSNSIVNDAIIIEVATASASVRSADIIGSTEIRVVFDKPIDRSTVIDSANRLLNSIEITTRKNVKGVMSPDPGTLTATLSTDLKTLTITASNTFEGEYGINFTNRIKTTDGLTIQSEYKLLSFVDTAPPMIQGVTLDDSGMISKIQFSEAVDFTNLNVLNATLIPTTGSSTTTADPNTYTVLNNKLNYIASADKKSLSINLSKIPASDYGKTFSVTLTGIKDLSGNTPASFTLTAYVRTDATQKPQARPIVASRSGFNTVTVTFDRAINPLTAGWATINGSTYIGAVDALDSKKVNYAISDADAQLTGLVIIKVGFWNSYNVMPSDTYANQMRDMSVDFTTDRTSPVMYSYDFDVTTSTLTLTFNEDVVLNLDTGIFNSILVTNNDDIQSGTNITYTKLPSTDNKIVKLKLSNMTLAGTYTFTMDQGFAKDNFRNQSIARQITITNTSGTTTNELPGPFVIRQSTENLSQIYLDFINKLDVTSAQTATNYTIPGVTILSAVVTNNTANGATVMLTVGDGTIDVSIERPVRIAGVKGYTGNLGAITNFSQYVFLKENARPTYLDPPVFDNVSKNVIRLNFSEPIQGTLKVDVKQFAAVGPSIQNTVTISGNSAFINLGIPQTSGTYLLINVTENNITDMNGNKATIQPSMGVMATY